MTAALELRIDEFQVLRIMQMRNNLIPGVELDAAQRISARLHRPAISQSQSSSHVAGNMIKAIGGTVFESRIRKTCSSVPD